MRSLRGATASVSITAKLKKMNGGKHAELAAMLTASCLYVTLPACARVCVSVCFFLFVCVSLCERVCV